MAAGSTCGEYRYDPLGRRVAKERLGGDRLTVVEEIRFTWDGTTLCEQTTASAALPNPVVLTWDHQALRPLSQTERILSDDASQRTVDERFFAVVTDLVGAPTELVDESGSLAVTSHSLPPNWKYFQFKSGPFSLCPAPWNAPGFWEAYYEGDPYAIAMYEKHREVILLHS
ncbi:hypothetical protein [Streptomyces cyaneofuscatus]|uniref:hypothetical protein n=1 Tax=Streptomyces cyaneofuscatus TaxID=66883 RepID=UPI0037936868